MSRTGQGRQPALSIYCFTLQAAAWQNSSVLPRTGSSSLPWRLCGHLTSSSFRVLGGGLDDYTGWSTLGIKRLRTWYIYARGRSWGRPGCLYRMTVFSLWDAGLLRISISDTAPTFEDLHCCSPAPSVLMLGGVIVSVLCAHLKHMYPAPNEAHE